MRILFILDSVENPTSANVLMAQRLAGVLCAAGHTVHSDLLRTVSCTDLASSCLSLCRMLLLQFQFI